MEKNMKNMKNLLSHNYTIVLRIIDSLSELCEWISHEELRLVRYNITKGVIHDPKNIFSNFSIKKVIEYADIENAIEDFKYVYDQIKLLKSSDLVYPDRYISNRLLSRSSPDGGYVAQQYSIVDALYCVDKNGFFEFYLLKLKKHSI
jgi:hypothetical protein